MEKILITYEQAEALENAFKYQHASNDSDLMWKHTRGWKGLYSPLNGIGAWDFANILFSGRQYEVDPTTTPDFHNEQSHQKWLELGREEVGLADGDIVIKDSVAYDVVTSLRGRGREVTLKEAEKWRHAGMLLGFYPSESFTGLNYDGEPPCRKCGEDRCACPSHIHTKSTIYQVEQSGFFCNYCGKHCDYVELLIAGVKGKLKSYICNECVGNAHELVSCKLNNKKKSKEEML